MDIPWTADEMVSPTESSFLGRMIHAKTSESYVYNFRRKRMGEDPDRVQPGQEIVIVKFAPAELIEIYKEFVQPPA